MAHLESLVVLDAAGAAEPRSSFGFERAGYKVYATARRRGRAGHGADARAAARGRRRRRQRRRCRWSGACAKRRRRASCRWSPSASARAREEALRAGVDEFVARPAFIRDVLTLSRLAVAVRQDGDDGGVVGLLEDYGLYFLVRALAVAGRSCVMELERGQRIGEVQVAKGAVVAARVGRMTGRERLPSSAAVGRGVAVACASSRRRPSGASAPTSTSCSEMGARFAAEFEALSARVGGPQAVYGHEPRRAAEARAQIPAEVMVLRQAVRRAQAAHRHRRGLAVQAARHHQDHLSAGAARRHRQAARRASRRR